MKKIAFSTLGCKVNQADTASMELLFRQAGYEVVDFAAAADVYLINTCVVTNMGQRKSRQMINRAVRLHPDSLVVVTGCYPQTAREEVLKIPGVDVIIGNQERLRVVELTEQALKRKKGQVLDGVQPWEDSSVFDELPAGKMDGHTRAFLKIQEGCNQFCTYCLIPYARGRLRSRSLAGIRREVEKLVAAGFKEVVLIGIHLGCYGKETGEHTLAEAVQAALAVPGLARLRLGSLESVEVDAALLELMKGDQRFCPHLHLPLQSGCDRILQAMHRPYDTAKFRSLVEQIREKIPGIALTTDVIVGFPGETEADFKATCAFVREMGFAKVHIFPYSKRQGTPASELPGQLTEAAKAERVRILGAIDRESQQEFHKGMIGRRVEVLLEQLCGPDLMEGLTSNYQRVQCPGSEAEANTFCSVRITGVQGDLLTGERIK